jgi:hypothetical protein
MFVSPDETVLQQDKTRTRKHAITCGKQERRGEFGNEKAKKDGRS